MTKFIMRDDGTPVEVGLLEWARWFDVEANRRIAFDTVGEIKVSTMFLGNGSWLVTRVRTADQPLGRIVAGRIVGA